MPTARPIIVMMLVAKIDTSNQTPMRMVRAVATAMATAASASGTSAATTAPKTRTRMIIAIGTPISSPRRRSEVARSCASMAHVPSPVIATAKPSRPSSARTRS